MKKYVILLLLITCLGTGLRVYKLGDKSLWFDEAASVYHAEVSIPSLVEKLANSQNNSKQQILQVAQEWRAHQPSHPPLYFILLHFWMAVGRDEITLRLLSTLVGVVSIPMVYRLAKALFNESVGLLSALLLATSPFHVYYSREARMYTLIMLLALVSVYCVVGFLKTNAWAWRIGYVVSMALNLYTHYSTVFVLAFQNAIVLIFAWQQKDKKRLLIWLAMQGSVLLLFAPWMSVALFQVAAENNTGGQLPLPLIEFPRKFFATFSLGYYAGHLPRWVKAIGFFGFPILFLYGLFAPGANGAVKGKRRWRITQEAAFCLIYLSFAALGVLVLMWQKPPFPIRAALFGLPAYYILVARGIERIRVGSKAKLSIAIALVGLLLFPIAQNIYQRGPQEDWRGVANHVVSHSQPEDVVVLHSSYIHIPFDYYAKGQVSTYVGLVGVKDQPQNIPAMIEEAVQGHKRLWLVLSRMNYADPDWAVKKYLDAHYRMLDERPFQGFDGVFLYGLQRGKIHDG